MLIVVTVKTGKDKLDLTVHGRSELLHLIGILEKAASVDALQV